MDDDLYDEFGNLVGEDQNTSEEQASSSRESDFGEDSNIPEGESQDAEVLSNALVKTDLNDVYGDEVEVLVETENTQSINEPLVAPSMGRSRGKEYGLFSQLRKNVPKTKYDREYLLSLLAVPERIRNVAVIGPLHSGKTSLCDLLVLESHEKMPHVTKNIRQGWKQLKYTDTMKQEVQRGLSTKLNGFTLLSTDLNNNSIAMNVLDAPGHVNFMDEVAVALTASEIAIIVLDIVEGVTSVVEQLIKQCEKRKIKMIFLLNKIDRLIIEMKLPPLDAYLKIKHCVDKINSFTKDLHSPVLGNVLFASTKLNFTFSIREFVTYHYMDRIPNSKVDGLIDRLWGDYHFKNGQFVEITNVMNETPTFLDFILLPLYKIITQTLSVVDYDKLADSLEQNFNIHLNQNEISQMDSLPLLRHVLTLIFRTEAGLTHVIAQNKIAMLKSDKKLLARALKTLDYGGNDYTLLKIQEGVLDSNSKFFVIDSNKDFDEDEKNFDESLSVTEIALMGARYVYNVDRAGPGQIVLVKGISSAFDKSATIVANDTENIEGNLFKPLDYINYPCFKVFIQPLVPKELPKLLNALNKINKYYPGVVIKVEESGEHVILGFGELYMDCLLYDLRTNYANIEIKISDPVAIFTESCQNESFAAIPVTSSSGKLSISIGAKPLDRAFLKDLSKGKLNEFEIDNQVKTGNMRDLSRKLREEYGWDSLTARNVWTFHNCNVLVDDTLPDETDKTTLNKYKSQIKQGFYWAMREGPLCEEDIYGIQFQLLGFELQNGDDDNEISGSQLIPMIRKACYIAMMTASPIIMEPIYEVNIVAKSAILPIVEELFHNRRGAKIYRVAKIVGTPLLEVRGQIPVIESIGFETDLRLSTRGNAMCQLHFWSKIWRKVPGDVLDENAVIPKLKPAPIQSLSRDFVMKTRKRKGISNDGITSHDGPSLAKYIDPELFEQLKSNDLI
ncbi:hypothetical protein KAFR_0G00400 [Kazachstania africana CBS 2517]|uniref:Tr-type G domain-containing protein n=1 Tax=Kazachstania africana (strain ATCC 22294 / BCRC 22015 / CBS 2517 / CECT 1963 / NBRC 1671 / NRRL Y-8276) TaxID=1071382 RepID=H2AXH3_KAZAF|nr:hypothetical protein KAFR_0G00400 [Kazachstania africana CBS 2517]CCF59073.1 hypothetical protein KAFR_0G00400 [Kazachstania africana CBS 2517]